jgi:phenylacetate-coenzyme A ligase PaaK-like adenylate-forming protein
VLRQVWRCNVFDRFSASELGNYVALECEHGGFHVNDLYYYAEVVRDGRHVAPGELGHLVVTTLQETLPMIRYETNDLVVAAGPERCPCGSVTTRVASFEGRLKDVLIAADGTARTERSVDSALAAVDGLRFYQVAQPSRAAYDVKVVAAPGANPAQVRSAAGEALREVMGAGAEIRVSTARRIYPETSGKFRFTRCEVPGYESLVVAYPRRSSVV